MYLEVCMAICLRYWIVGCLFGTSGLFVRLSKLVNYVPGNHQ